MPPSLGSNFDPSVKNLWIWNKWRKILAKVVHNGQNDLYERQFSALGVHSQCWKLNNLSNQDKLNWYFFFSSNWLVFLLVTTIWQKNAQNNFSWRLLKVSDLKRRWQAKGSNRPWFLNANLILLTSPNWINCFFSIPSKIRVSFCQNC